MSPTGQKATKCAALKSHYSMSLSARATRLAGTFNPAELMRRADDAERKTCTAERQGVAG